MISERWYTPEYFVAAPAMDYYRFPLDPLIPVAQKLPWLWFALPLSAAARQTVKPSNMRCTQNPPILRGFCHLSANNLPGQRRANSRKLAIEMKYPPAPEHYA